MKVRSNFALYTEAGLETVLQRHSDNISAVADLKRVSGSRFTFFHFLDFLVQLSWTAFSSSKRVILSEMLCMSLERMELSKGMRELDRKITRTQFSKLSLLPSKWIEA
jgi:hypothetical protein